MQHASMSQKVDPDSVRHKAYELWVNGGRRDGVAEQNWLEAEQIVSSTQAAPSTQTTPVAQPESAPPASAAMSFSAKTAAKPNGSPASRKR